MDAQGWIVLVAAIGTLVLQVLGRVQAWHLAVIAIRSEAKQDAAQRESSKDVAAVHALVNSQMSALQAELRRSNEEVAELKARLASSVERDARTAEAARKAGAA